MRTALFVMPAAWSLCVLSPASPPRQHVITPYFPHARRVLDEAFPGGVSKWKDWQILDMTFPNTHEGDDDNENNDSTLSMPALSLLPLVDPTPSSTTTSTIPFVRPRSTRHAQAFFASAYAKHMSYPQFCEWESRVARVVFSYLGDTRRHWIVEIDPFFLYSDSIRDYGTREAVAQTFWITPSVEIGVPDAVLFSKEFGETSARLHS